MDDIDSRVKTKTDYSYVKNPRLFAEVETRLFEYSIIDTQYYFIKSKKQSNHTLLAAVYHMLIDKNYFRRNILGSKDKIRDKDIRQYLDSRYATDTSQQFRKMNPELLEKASRKLPWLINIVKIP